MKKIRGGLRRNRLRVLLGVRSLSHPNGTTLEDDARADVHLRGLARWIGHLRGEPCRVLLIASPKANREPRVVHDLDIAVPLRFERTDSDILTCENTPADSDEQSDKDENDVEDNDRPIVTAVSAHRFSLLKELFSTTELQQRLSVFQISDNATNIAYYELEVKPNLDKQKRPYLRPFSTNLMIKNFSVPQTKPPIRFCPQNSIRNGRRPRKCGGRGFLWLAFF